MRIGLYGPFLFELAVGLKEHTAHEVCLFLDKKTMPRSLREESQLADRSFIRLGDWETRQAILCPRVAPITRELSRFDVVLVTELGPVFAAQSGVQYVFIPTGWDLTCGPFPIRARRTRSRGVPDLTAAIIAARLRGGIRKARSIWAAPFKPFTEAVERLGCSIGTDLPQPIDTQLFSPDGGLGETPEAFDGLTIFHPARMMFTPDPFLVETGQCKWNDLLLRGFADAVAQGVEAQLVLLERASSPDEALAKELIHELGVDEKVRWLSPETPDGFSWRELALLYQSSDIVVDEFGGWFGLVALEGASCGKPVINCVDEEAMALMYPGGHPFLQAQTRSEVCDLIVLLSESERRETLGKASQKWVVDNHDRGVVARRCESTLSTLGMV